MFEIPAHSLWPPTQQEIDDVVLAALPARNVRVMAEELLRVRRLPPCCVELMRIADFFNERIAAADHSATLEDHLNREEKKKAYQSLAATISEQLAWHKRQVHVERDEVNALVTRWLLLNYGGQK